LEVRELRAKVLFRGKLLAGRRPSAALVVSVIALFVALGGVGYAAIQVPANSVGTAQLQNASVTNWKILNGVVGNFKLAWGAVGPRKMMNGAVGLTQINTSQVQARVIGTCQQSGQAIATINSSGGVSCASTAPREFGTSSGQVAVTPGTHATQIVAKTVPGGSPFLVFGQANVQVTGTTAGQWVRVACTLAPGGSGNAQTNVVTLHVGPNPEAETIPFVVPTGAATASSASSIGCTYTKATGGTVPTVSVSASMSALATSSNS
jgi:hypothetical protein